MKTTYKLIGLFWDRQPIPSKKPDIICINDISINDSVITISEILNTPDELLENKLHHTQKAKMLVDYIPNARTKMVLQFYTKRLLQISEYLSAIIVCKDIDMANMLNCCISKFYV